MYHMMKMMECGNFYVEKHGFALESVCDGETFGPLTEESQRYFFCAVKQYTQLEG